MALVLIDDCDVDIKKEAPNNNVPRALFGLLKTCRSIRQFAKKTDEKNLDIEKVAKDRLKELYAS